ncbi:MAG: sigma-70 family RNA polymerase sigma factor [Pseudomonadota bacterium]
MFADELEKLLPEIRAYARMLCVDRDLSDDIVQNACLKAWKAQKSFDPEKGTLKAWMFVITRNEFLQYIRKNKRVDLHAPTDFENWLTQDCPMSTRAACSDAIKELFALNPDQRDVFILVVAAGYSYEEAASILNCSVGTVKSRINRSREKLQARLTATEDDSVQDADDAFAFLSIQDVFGRVDALVQPAA